MTTDVKFMKCAKHTRDENILRALDNINLMLTLEWSHNVNSHTHTHTRHTHITIFKERTDEPSDV